MPCLCKTAMMVSGCVRFIAMMVSGCVRFIAMMVSGCVRFIALMVSGCVRFIAMMVSGCVRFRASEERGWMLMVLLCATATPHGELFDQTVAFLRGARKRPARACAEFLTAQKSYDRKFSVSVPRCDSHLLSLPF